MVARSSVVVTLVRCVHPRVDANLKKGINELGWINSF
jgi:hypothetical protein